MVLELILQDPNQFGNGSLKELVVDVHEMLRHYYKGFSGALTVILGNAELFHTGGDKRSAQVAEEALREIENFYSAIPFEALQTQEYYPLFVVRDFMVLLRHSFENLKKEREGALAVYFINEHTRTMRHVGELYKGKIVEKIERIRSFPEGKNFDFSIIDGNGNSWSRDTF